MTALSRPAGSATSRWRRAEGHGQVTRRRSDGPLAGEPALVLLASPEPVDSKVETRRQPERPGHQCGARAGAGRKGDCSLSNYAVLSGHPDYFNVTVDDDEGEKQRQIIDVIMSSSFTVSAAR